MPLVCYSSLSSLYHLFLCSTSLSETSVSVWMTRLMYDSWALSYLTITFFNYGFCKVYTVALCRMRRVLFLWMRSVSNHSTARRKRSLSTICSMTHETSRSTIQSPTIRNSFLQVLFYYSFCFLKRTCKNILRML